MNTPISIYKLVVRRCRLKLVICVNIAKFACYLGECSYTSQQLHKDISAPVSRRQYQALQAAVGMTPASTEVDTPAITLRYGSNADRSLATPLPL